MPAGMYDGGTTTHHEQYNMVLLRWGWCMSLLGAMVVDIVGGGTTRYHTTLSYPTWDML